MALLDEGLMPVPTEAIEVPLPSDSYLQTIENIGCEHRETKREGIFTILITKSYQYLNLLASGVSGLISTVLLPIVDKDTPATATSGTHNNLFLLKKSTFHDKPVYDPAPTNLENLQL